MATTAGESVQKITNDLQAAQDSLRRTARNISGLLAVGRAACDEVKAYNLWAMSLYNTQRGMLTSLRLAGEKGVPELPPYPTFFAWAGQSGENAYKIDCGGSQDLTGVLRDAMDPQKPPQYLSSQQVMVVTTDQNAFDPESAPSLAALVNAVGGPINGSALGLAPVIWLIIVAGIALSVSVGIYALSDYLTEKAIQEETSNRVKLQADAFDKYTAARMQCYADCTARGNAVGSCVDACAKLVDKPNLKIDSARADEGMGFWGTIGLVAAAAASGIGAWKLFQRHQERHGY